jgi:hypothetical protein
MISSWIKINQLTIQLNLLGLIPLTPFFDLRFELFSLLVQSSLLMNYSHTISDHTALSPHIIQPFRQGIDLALTLAVNGGEFVRYFVDARFFGGEP